MAGRNRPTKRVQVAGALNCALQAYGEPTTQLASVQRASSAGHMFQRVKSSGAANEGSGGGCVIEQDVIDYYCKWSQEAGKINCHAALRGSCGLIPSTRKTGNPRLLRTMPPLADAAGCACARGAAGYVG